MTANHEHILSTAQVRFAATFPNENFSLKGTDFDRWLAERDARIEAAAEQRGADKAIAVFEEMSDDMGEAIAFDVITTPHGEAEYPVSHFREKLQEAINDATDQTRADQIANKEGDGA